MLFVVEDNGYAISVTKDASTAIKRNSDRAAAYGIPGEFIENNDTMAVFRAAGEGIARARAGEGPMLIEIETYRYYGHFQGDAEAYRPAGEVEELKGKDPIDIFRAYITGDGGIGEQEADGLADKARKEVDAAIEFARNSPYPETRGSARESVRLVGLASRARSRSADDANIGPNEQIRHKLPRQARRGCRGPPAATGAGRG